jgi:translation elongation factor EF-Tu-like GTPase
MFKEEPKDKCMQWKGVNVGTIGHHSHGKSLLLNAMLALAIKSKKD